MRRVELTVTWLVTGLRYDLEPSDDLTRRLDVLDALLTTCFANAVHAVTFLRPAWTPQSLIAYLKAVCDASEN